MTVKESRVDLELNPRVIETLLTGFIAEETKRAGMTRVVVGLSGGIDSAVAAALARRALGARGVIAVMMPYRTSSPDSLLDARALAAKLGIRKESVEITPMVDAYFENDPRAGKRRRGNKMARERMSILYDRSMAHEALVLGTSNKTELLLGYGTVHGDMASSINPIGDLYKTQVRSLAEHLRIPRVIRDKPPTADLWPDQTDETEIGIPYEELDQILALLIDLRYTGEAVVKAGWPRPLVRKVQTMIIRTQYKRRLPLIAKISERTIGIDFRYPRDWNT